MSTLDLLNSWPVYLICGVIILFVMLMSIFFMVRAWRAGIAIGMDRTKLRRTVLSSCTFTLVPSISILVGVLTLSGSLGVPLPWLRLSVIGALHYELSVADIAARAVGLSGLNASEMTPEAFTTIALVMSAGIIWGMVLTIFFNKRYTQRLQKPKSNSGKKGGKSLGDVAMTSMFIGLVAAYVGSYVGTFTSTGNILPLIVLLSSAAAMAVFTYFIEKKKVDWLENFSIAGSMLIGMAVAVLTAGLM
ncbi:MAG: DUF5058 family protein [Oscillospiraceae bacterium]|nr:DUF5058 family protein [Oscillospiraceae bacterium]